MKWPRFLSPAFLLATLAIAALAIVPACGATQGQVENVLKLDEGKATIYADVVTTSLNLVDAVDKAVPADSLTHARMVEARAYFQGQNARYEQLARDTVRAVMSLQELPPEKQQEYLETVFRIIDRINEGRAGPSPPATP